MPPLDPEGELILRTYVSNGSKQVEAWRVAHPNSKASPKTQHEKASRFFAQGKVQARLAELHLEVVKLAAPTVAFSLEDHLEKLRQLRDEARERGQMSAAIQAEVKRGEAKRFYVRQIETGDAGEFDRMTTEELRAFVYGEEPAEPATKH